VRQTIIEILMKELVGVAKEQNIKHIALAGGVSANIGLRRALEEKALELEWTTYLPKVEYCTDNGAMIAIAGYFALLNGAEGKLDLAATARWKMD
jgi:N6-L-threonylcarbamoyladenine synthase